jgi:tryptophan synthase alpha chain
VTITGITGGDVELPQEITHYLDSVKNHTSLPVCAGFGVRHPEQVQLIGRHATGVIVGSALVERLEAGEDPSGFLQQLTA